MDDAFARIQNDPILPRVLLIGDSISIGYTVAVRRRLAEVANVHRILENGGPTSNGLAKLESWLGDGPWAVIHFNFGLHDLKVMEDGQHQVPIPAYRANLEKIVARLRLTRAKLIWATTTPVPEGPQNPLRRTSDLTLFNAAALEVMKKTNMPVNDLYAFAAARIAEIQEPHNVHFTAAGYEALAEPVAECIRAALP